MTPPFVCSNSCITFSDSLSMTGKSALCKRRGHFILSTAMRHAARPTAAHAGMALHKLMEAEVDQQLGAEKSERADSRSG